MRITPHQVLRRTCLTLSVALLVLVPLWHLGHLDPAARAVDSGEWTRSVEASIVSGAAPRIIGGPWSIDLLGIEWIDPLAATSLIVLGKGSPAIVIALIPTLLSVVLLGRFFCGWICPYVPIVGLSHMIRRGFAAVGVRLPDLSLGRGTSIVVLLGVLMLTAVGGVTVAAWLYPPAIIGRQLLRGIYLGGVGGGLAVVFIAFLFDTFVSRAGFCRFLCPGGAMFRVLGVASPVLVERDRSRCDPCGACNQVCALDQSPMTDQLDSGCERCGKCVAVCPTQALRIAVRPVRPRLFHRGTTS